MLDDLYTAVWDGEDLLTVLMDPDDPIPEAERVVLLDDEGYGFEAVQ